jgi:sporulation-control protein
MFKKILARFGKGAATVDLRFDNRPYYAGETINGEVRIQGGEVEQKVNFLAARLMMGVATKHGTETREVAKIPLSNAFVILPKEQKVIPFTYSIPQNLPVSRGTISYYFDTQLDIEGGVDRKDVDRLSIEVPKQVQVIFQALDNLGFREKHTSGKVDQYGQEFAFFPTQDFTGQVNEIELRFAHEESGIRVWMEVDCRNGFLEIELKREFYLELSVLQNESGLTQLLKEYITEVVDHPQAYTQPFSYTSHDGYQGHHGNGIGGMVGGLAMGILGGMLLSEMIDGLGVDEMIEGAAEAVGFDEEAFGGEEEADFGSFFDGGDDGDW